MRAKEKISIIAARVLPRVIRIGPLNVEEGDFLYALAVSESLCTVHKQVKRSRIFEKSLGLTWSSINRSFLVFFNN